MSRPPITQQTIDGLKAGICVVGEGPAVLLLHGWGGSLQSMWPVARELAALGYAAHILDLPGFGESDLPSEPWTVARYAEWVMAYLKTTELDEVFLIGHSFGGRISLVLGADYPQHIKKIALSNSAGIRLPLTFRMRIYQLGRKVVLGALSLPGLGRVKNTVRGYFRQRFGSEDYLNAGPLVETFKLVIKQDLRVFARRVQAPTLLFWGDLDQDTPLAGGRILEQEMPDAALIVFEGAGHFAYLDQLSRFIRITDHFFAGKT
jgi:pimeloyl-ACP methyl ester carboxylesterase